MSVRESMLLCVCACVRHRGPAPGSDALHIVAGKGAEAAAALRCADKPAVVAFLQHVNGVALEQLQLVGVLWPVIVYRTVAASREQTHTHEDCNWLAMAKYYRSDIRNGLGGGVDVQHFGLFDGLRFAHNSAERRFVAARRTCVARISSAADAADATAMLMLLWFRLTIAVAVLVLAGIVVDGIAAAWRSVFVCGYSGQRNVVVVAAAGRIGGGGNFGRYRNVWHVDRSDVGQHLRRIWMVLYVNYYMWFISW